MLAGRDSVRQWAKMWLESRIDIIPPFAREIAATALTAELAAAETPAEQLAAYQAYRDRLAAIEKDTRTEVERRRYNPYDYLKIKEMLCDAEVVLGRMKAGAGKQLESDPPEVRAALDDWVRTIGFEGDVIRKRYDAGKVPFAESLGVDDSLLREELVAATKPEQRIAAYKKYLGKLREAEVSLKSRAADSAAARQEFARVAFTRAGTELTLMQLTAAPGAKPSPAYRALLVEQRDALQSQLQQRFAEWAAAQDDFQQLQESAGQLLLASLDLAEKPADRLAAYEAHAATMRAAERQCQVIVAAKQAPEVWLLWARGGRLEAETWLLRARAKLSVSAKP